MTHNVNCVFLEKRKIENDFVPYCINKKRKRWWSWLFPVVCLEFFSCKKCEYKEKYPAKKCLPSKGRSGAIKMKQLEIRLIREDQSC